MQKELNPQLFGEVGAKSRVVEKNSANSQHQMEMKLHETRQQVSILNENLQRVVQQVNEFMRTNHSKVERVHSALQKLEQNDLDLANETGKKMAQLSLRLTERKGLDDKVQDLVDRQNNVLRSFEVRLNHMQKMLNEKDAQLVSTMAALNEAKMEIARLKRF